MKDQALYGDQLLWARPILLFHEKVLYGSQEVPRLKPAVIGTG